MTPDWPELVVDHGAGTISGAAVARTERIDYITPEVLERFRAAINGTLRRERTGDAVRLDDCPPEAIDAWLGLWFQGGPRDHLAGLRAPLCRLGHPTEPNSLRLDLAVDVPGVVVGSIEEATIVDVAGERQLLATIRLLRSAPIPKWHRIRARLLALAAEFPLHVGASMLFARGPRPVLVAVDLVRVPAANTAGLLGRYDRLDGQREIGQRDADAEISLRWWECFSQRARRLQREAARAAEPAAPEAGGGGRPGSFPTKIAASRLAARAKSTHGGRFSEFRGPGFRQAQDPAR